MNQQMSIETSDLDFPHRVEREAENAAASHTTTLEVLCDLLTQSIRLRDLYRNARLQIAGAQFPGLRRILDIHYKEQLRLIDMIVDRIRILGGAVGVFASEFLQSSQVGRPLRGAGALNRLLSDFVEAHESLLSTASSHQPKADQQWVRDLAVGQVVVTNQQQYDSIRDIAWRIEPLQKYGQTDV